jgi:hypothetical protein
MLVLGSMENSAVVLAFLLTKVRARPFHKTSPFMLVSDGEAYDDLSKQTMHKLMLIFGLYKRYYAPLFSRSISCPPGLSLRSFQLF